MPTCGPASGLCADKSSGRRRDAYIREPVDVAATDSAVRDLCVLLERNIPAIEAALENHTLVEVDRLAVTPVAQLRPVLSKQSAGEAIKTRFSGR